MAEFFNFQKMDGDTIRILIAMVIYMAAVIGIGIAFAKKANTNSENYFLGGRSLGPWVTAMSAEASDMSGWLLMGLPGVAYWCGLADAAWTAIGLAIGTYFNWLIVSKRLRRYSIRANNSITLPEFFSNRFRENKKVIMTLAALFILIFFTNQYTPIYINPLGATIAKSEAKNIVYVGIPECFKGSSVHCSCVYPVVPDKTAQNFAKRPFFAIASVKNLVFKKVFRY